jgi:DNA-binding IscR family transcriptional regulator
MLEKILAEIRAGGTLEVGALADRLGASPALVEMMLEHLQRAGYIQPYTGCAAGCGGCSLRSDCDPSSKVAGLRLWQAGPGLSDR